MKKIAFATIFIFLFVAAFSLSTAQPVQAKKILLKCPVSFATVLPGLGDVILWISKQLEAASGGTTG